MHCFRLLLLARICLLHRPFECEEQKTGNDVNSEAPSHLPLLSLRRRHLSNRNCGVGVRGRREEYSHFFIHAPRAHPKLLRRLLHRLKAMLQEAIFLATFCCETSCKKDFTCNTPVLKPATATKCCVASCKKSRNILCVTCPSKPATEFCEN